MRRAFRSLVLGLAWASIWPGYLVLVAQAARLGPWPRNLGILASTVLHGLALGALRSGGPGLADAAGRLDRAVPGRSRGGRPAALPHGPVPLRRGRGLPGARVPAVQRRDRPRRAAHHGRGLLPVLHPGVRACGLGTLVSLLRRGSALMRWCDLEPSRAAGENPGPNPNPSASAVTSIPDPAFTAAEHGRLRLAGLAQPAPAGGGLDPPGACRRDRGARRARLPLHRQTAGHRRDRDPGALPGLLGLESRRESDHHPARRRWVRPGRSWALALTTAVTLRGSSRTRDPEVATTPSERGLAADTVQPEDLAGRLRQLVFYLAVLLGALGFAWVWELDLALIRFLANQPLWSLSETPVTLGDLAKSTVVILLGSLAWRYMSTLFALTLFPRIPDDPGVRFAIVTLCRYVVLGVTTIAALGAIHVGTAQIGMVLAALGVGLGFGLQEIVSNFVCGIILLLERPIRIGDVVTVAGTTGKVDRINIRATTIINGDNQSMIVPNREFITGNLVNWTHKDKILRVTIRVGVAVRLRSRADRRPPAGDRPRRPGRAPQSAALGLARRAGRFGAQVRPLRLRSRSQPCRPREASALRRGPAPVCRGEHRHSLSDPRGPSLPRARRPHARARAAAWGRQLGSPRFDPATAAPPPPHAPTPSCRLPGISPSPRAMRAFTGRSMIRHEVR